MLLLPRYGNIAKITTLSDFCEAFGIAIMTALLIELSKYTFNHRNVTVLLFLRAMRTIIIETVGWISLTVALFLIGPFFLVLIFVFGKKASEKCLDFLHPESLINEIQARTYDSKLISFIELRIMKIHENESQ